MPQRALLAWVGFLFPFAILCAVFLASSGCMKREAQLTPAKPVEVVVTPAVVRDVIDFEDFTGRLEAVSRVEIRAQVKGYLINRNFKEGAEVKKGELLFEIDPKIYQAEYDRTEANVAQAHVVITRLKADYERAKILRQSKAIPQADFDKITGDYNEAVAHERVAIASREVAKTNLAYTKVYAEPVGGLASRSMIDPGNFVDAEKTLLTTIVSLDPIYAYFDIDERTLLRLRRLIREGHLKSSRETDMAVMLALSDEDDFKDHIGTINFVENRLDPTTGTLRVRAVFPNPRRLLSPGLFVRVRVPIGTPHPSVVIPEIAVGSDQGQKFVYVVDQDNEVSYRKIKAGPQIKTYRVIEEPTFKLKKDGSYDVDAEGKKILVEGVREGEKVVVAGLQRVRPRIKVDAKVEEIPASTVLVQMPGLFKTQLTQNRPAPGPAKDTASAP